MGEFLLVGAIVGAGIGLLHAIHLFRERLECGRGGVGRALWFAGWALALWTLAGAYVLALWLIAAVVMAAARLVAGRRVRA